MSGPVYCIIRCLGMTEHGSLIVDTPTVFEAPDGGFYRFSKDEEFLKLKIKSWNRRLKKLDAENDERSSPYTLLAYPEDERANLLPPDSPPAYLDVHCPAREKQHP